MAEIFAETILHRPDAEQRALFHPARSIATPFAAAVAGSAFVAVCAHLMVPLLFTPVPLSMAPFAVVLLGLLFTPRLALAALSLYLLEGAAGLPVFGPQGPGGAAQLLGPTGGYLLSYPFAAAVASLLYRRRNLSPGVFLRGVFSAGTASVLILIAGASWLKFITHLDARLVFAQAVAPFLPGDILKILAAAGAASGIGALRKPRRRDESL